MSSLRLLVRRWLQTGISHPHTRSQRGFGTILFQTRTLQQYNSPISSGSRSYASKANSRGKDTDKNKQKNIRRDDRESSHKGNAISTSSLIAGSEQPLSGQSLADYNDTEKKMQQTVDWLRKECSTMEGQGLGRVNPTILQSVRVELPGGRKGGVALSEVAVVGVREGTTLIVTAMQDSVRFYLYNKTAKR